MVPNLVLIESPYRGNSYEKIFENIIYARLCVINSLSRGEIPFASHLLYAQTGITDDRNPEERKRGIAAGWRMGEFASLSAFYIDMGWSSGMLSGKETAEKIGRPIEERSLGGAKEVASMIEKLASVKSSVNDGIPF